MNQFDFPDVIVCPIGPETTYILINKQTGDILIVDPTKKSIDTIAGLKDKGFFKDKLIYVWITHPHNDHFDGVSQLREILEICVICHELFSSIQNMLNNISFDELCEKFPSSLPFYGDILAQWGCEFAKLKIDKFVPNGKLDDWPLKISCLEGHSLIDCVLSGDGFVISGDIIFVDGNEISYGRMDLPGSSQEQFINEISAMVKLCNPKCIFFPGHHQPFGSSEWLTRFREWLKEQEECIDEDEEELD